MLVLTAQNPARTTITVKGILVRPKSKRGSSFQIPKSRDVLIQPRLLQPVQSSETLLSRGKIEGVSLNTRTELLGFK